MILEGDELSKVVNAENRYITKLKKRWGVSELPDHVEHYLRMGKRLEMLGNIQKRKEGTANDFKIQEGQPRTNQVRY